MTERHVWVDASAGVAGDMLLGALVDAGADLGAVQGMVDTVLPGSVKLTAAQVTRAGQRSVKVGVDVLDQDLPRRDWGTIQGLLTAAPLPGRVREGALRTFEALAVAEAHVHGITVGQVHFHEVGALDSLADIMGVCAALHLLDVDTVSAGPVAVGTGRVRAAHGDLPVPVPAVVRLAEGWSILAGGPGELTTPTGMALLTALGEACEPLPPMTLERSGAGAGTRDTAGRPNVTRVLVGSRTGAHRGDPSEAMVILEANIDDLDSRLWPGVLDRLLAAGAADAWLVPIVMKKGRPAHTVSVLCRQDQSATLREVIWEHTSTIGVRAIDLRRFSLPRGWFDVDVHGHKVSVKVAHRGGVIVQATPEFADVAALARRLGRSEGAVLAQCQVATAQRGLVPGHVVPDRLRGLRETS